MKQEQPTRADAVIAAQKALEQTHGLLRIMQSLTAGHVAESDKQTIIKIPEITSAIRLQKMGNKADAAKELARFKEKLISQRTQLQQVITKAGGTLPPSLSSSTSTASPGLSSSSGVLAVPSGSSRPPGASPAPLGSPVPGKSSKESTGTFGKFCLQGYYLESIKYLRCSTIISIIVFHE